MTEEELTHHVVGNDCDTCNTDFTVDGVLPTVSPSTQDRSNMSDIAEIKVVRIDRLSALS